MKKIEKTLAVIALVCAILAACFGGYGYLSGGLEASKIPKEQVRNVTKTVKTTEDITINSSICSLSLETYDGKDIKISYPKAAKLPVDINESPNGLEINESSRWHRPRKVVTFFTLDLLKDFSNHFTIGVESGYRIKVLVPKNQDLEEVKIHLQAGDLSISEVTAKNADIKLSVGDLELDHVAFGQGEMKLSVGDLIVTSSALTNMTYKLNLGEAELSDSKLSHSDGKIDVGDFTGSDLIFKGVNKLDSSMGDISISLKDLNLSLSHTTEMGDANISSSLKDSRENSLKIKSSVGDLDVQ